MAVSDKPWGSFTPADYTPEQWKRACLVDRGEGDPASKGRYAVPVREPDGTLSRGGVHAAAGGHGIGAVEGISEQTRQAAARKLVGLYRNDLGEDPPESLLSLAGMRSGGDTMAAVERRFTLVPVELRTAGGNGEPARIGGYAAMFNRMSQNLGGFVEVVRSTFFNKSRGDGWPDVMCRYNHDDNMLLGTTGAGTLRLAIDDTGLVYDVTPPNSRADVVELVGRGDVRKSSFAFRLPAEGDQWGLSDQGYPLRELVTGQLVDTAPVNAPAYLDTSAGLRSLAAHVGADPEEVRAAAEVNELHRFLKVSSGAPMPRPKPRKLGAAAMVELLNRKADPWQ